MTQLTLRGRVTPADKANSDYYYIPFDLPLPADRLHVRYRYSKPISADRSEGGNVIDIGLFDPRGAEFPGGAGFRGWSGSARKEFVISTKAATPGYLPGLLPAGRYQIILGLYRLEPDGAEYTITVEADTADSGDFTPAAPPAAATPAGTAQTPASAERLFWLRGDLQSHTEHSDARGTPERLAAKAQRLGLDFLAVTDHNTVSHHAKLTALSYDKLLLIPGQEVTTYYGHMNVWGTSRWCDFRCKSPADMARIVELAHASGGLCSINHPKPGGPQWEYGDDLPVDAIEVWQGPWLWRNAESLSRWDALLSSGRRLPAVGGSDYHCPAGRDRGFLRLGQPTTWVRVSERSVPAILDALRHGRACISAAPDGPRLDLQASAGATWATMGETLPVPAEMPIAIAVKVEGGQGWTLRLIADGQVVDSVPISAPSATIGRKVTARRYVRAELVGDAPAALIPSGAPPDLDRRDWRWALSNPIYIDHAASQS